MLRKYIGEEDFRKSVRIYLERFKHKTAETDDLRQILEEVSSLNLQQFFDQWIYREGHPMFNLEVSDDNGKVRLSILQQQEGDAFVFSLEVNFVLRDSDNGSKRKERMELVQVQSKTFSKTFDIPMKSALYLHRSRYKILKEYVSINIPQNFITNEIKDGKTISEKLEAASLLKKHPLSTRIISNSNPCKLT